MNIKEAKAIPLTQFFSRLGFEPKSKYENFWWYKDPITNEKKPSLKINIQKNTWFNIATGRGGTIIDFMMAYESCNPTEALANISKVMGNNYFFSAPQNPISSEKKRGIEIITIKELGNNEALTDYLNSRAIKILTAKPFLKEVYYKVDKKRYFSLGWQNEKGGWELRNKYAKSATSKSYTFVSGQRANIVNVFEGMFDFLSALVYFEKEKADCDTIVLNSLVMVEQVLPSLLGYDKVSLFLDNDRSGSLATSQLINYGFLDRRGIYSNYKDFNEFLVAREAQG